MTFGTYIRRQRERLGMSQQDTAALSGISPQYLCDIELDRKVSPVETVQKLSDGLTLPFDVLCYYAGVIPPDLRGNADADHIAEIMAFVREELGHG